MDSHFFEIELRPGLHPADRADEDPLDAALRAAGVGEVTGGGSGMGVSHIDVEATDREAGLRLIRQVLRQFQVAPDMKIPYFGNTDQVLATYAVYDD